MANPATPGWYDDPQRPDQLRYFDGIVWTDHVQPRQTREHVGPTVPSAEELQRTWGHPAPGAPGATGHHEPRGQGGHPGQQWQGQPQQWGQAPGMPPGQAQWGYATGPTTRDGQPLASYLERVGAYIVDSLMLAVVAGIINYLPSQRAMAPYERFMQRWAENPEQLPDFSLSWFMGLFDWPWLVLATAVSAVIAVAYHVFCLSRWSATVGMRVIGISVRRPEQPGVLSAGRALRRQAIYLLNQVMSSTIVLMPVSGILSLVNVLWPLVDSRRQALHDKVADTVVVKGKQVG